jgi:para-nitrobenzyl esterase
VARVAVATFVLLCALLGLVAVGGPAGSSDASGPSGPSDGGPPGEIVRTDLGRVRGRVAADHVTYAGIPYAAPPVGERRWAPPARPSPWSGVRDATAPASLCAQSSYGEDGTPIVVGDEDCLYLNVTVPRDAGRRLPVMVWVHGGGSRSGGGSQYDGARLAAGGDVVVVTVNFRLGPLGFLSSEALDGSGNFGIQDQQAALRWVQRNADRFGGDPGNVTLFGQSSGGRNVCAHLASPGSRGLFARAILQSGPCATEVVTKDVADERGARVAAELGCTDPASATEAGAVADCLRSRPVADVVGVLPGERPPVTGEYRDEPWQPVAGTPVLPRQPIEALRRGSAAGVELMIGANRDDIRPFVGFEWDAGGTPLTVERYESLVAEAFGADAPAVLSRYPADAYPSPVLALSTVLSDWGGYLGSCPVLWGAEAAARHSRVFAYEFAEDSGEVYGGFPLGAYHGWDLPFLWDVSIPGSQYPELDAGQRELSERMIGWWTAFARHGDPNRAAGSGSSGGSAGPEWPRFRPGSDTVLSLAAGPGGVAPVDFAAAHRCDFWSSL